MYYRDHIKIHLQGINLLMTSKPASGSVNRALANLLSSFPLLDHRVLKEEGWSSAAIRVTTVHSHLPGFLLAATSYFRKSLLVILLTFLQPHLCFQISSIPTSSPPNGPRDPLIPSQLFQQHEDQDAEQKHQKQCRQFVLVGCYYFGNKIFSFREGIE